MSFRVRVFFCFFFLSLLSLLLFCALFVTLVVRGLRGGKGTGALGHGVRIIIVAMMEIAVRVFPAAGPRDGTWVPTGISVVESRGVDMMGFFSRKMGLC